MTLNSAARKGEQYCPYDGRYMAKGKRLVMSSTREKVHAWLMQLYEQVAESIPDGLNSNKRPRQGDKKRDNPNLNRETIKHLPYGTINDYYNQCVAAYPDLKIGRKLFTSETWMVQEHVYNSFFS